MTTAQSLIAIGAAIPFTLLASILAGVRLSVLAGDKVSLRDGIAVSMIAQLVILLAPTRLSELAKPVGQNVVSAVPMARALFAFAAERTLDAAFLALLAVIAVVDLGGSYAEPFQVSALVLGSIALAGLGIVTVLRMSSTKATEFIVGLKSSWLRAQVSNVKLGTEDVTRCLVPAFDGEARERLFADASESFNSVDLHMIRSIHTEFGVDNFVFEKEKLCSGCIDSFDYETVHYGVVSANSLLQR